MRQIKRPVLMVIPTLLYVFLYATSIVRERTDALEISGAEYFFTYALDMVMCFAYAWALFFTLRCLGKKTFAITLPFLFFTSAIAAYFIDAFNIKISGGTVGVLLEVEPTLILPFLTLKLVALALLSLGLGIALVRFCFKHELADPKDKMVLLISGMFVLMAFTIDGGISRQYMPYNYLRAAGDIVFLQRNTERTDISAEPATLVQNIPENLVVVLVVGESVRPSHLALNGYTRNTTPLLSERKNLTSYDDVPSCGPFTRDAVPCVLTRASYLSPEDVRKETSLISVFRKLGFYTSWVDMQGATASVFDSSITNIMEEANTHTSFNTSLLLEPKQDEAMLPIVEKTLAEQQGRVLMVLHGFGSHWPYTARYPAEFGAFQPVCSKTTAVVGDFKTSEDMAACDRQQLINAYDNSIVYLDYVLDSLMKQLENRPALLIYTSDHGESLGEDGLFLHGNVDKYGMPITIERRVPIIVWHSDSFKIQPINERITHDYIFHSLLDCAGVKSEIINPDLSICADE